jgi:hypothetical protein
MIPEAVWIVNRLPGFEAQSKICGNFTLSLIAKLIAVVFTNGRCCNPSRGNQCPPSSATYFS